MIPFLSSTIDAARTRGPLESVPNVGDEAYADRTVASASMDRREKIAAAGRNDPLGLKCQRLRQMIQRRQISRSLARRVAAVLANDDVESAVLRRRFRVDPMIRQELELALDGRLVTHEQQPAVGSGAARLRTGRSRQWFAVTESAPQDSTRQRIVGATGVGSKVSRVTFRMCAACGQVWPK